MLKVLFGKKYKDNVYDVDEYFNNIYEDDWFIRKDDWIVEMVKDIDKSNLIGMNVISPVLGSISIRDLSGGVKTLIMYYKLDDFITDLTMLGNNCEDWLLRIAEKKDIVATMNGYDMGFEGRESLNIFCINDNSIITDWVSWGEKMLEYV